MADPAELVDIPMPDGYVVKDVPVGTPKEVVLETWRKHTKAASGAVPQAPEEPTTFDKALGLAKAGGTGAVKAAISSTVGLPGDLADLGQLAANKLGLDVPEPTGEGFFPRSHEIYAKLPEMHKAANLPEQMTEGGVGGIVSTLNPFGFAGKGKVLSKGLAALGAAGGAGGELAANFMPDHPDAARALAFITALSPAAFAGFRKPNVVKAAQDYVNELGPEGLKAAQTNRAQASQTLGVPTLLSQGTEGSTALSSITDELKRTPMGTNIRRVLDVQPKVGQQKIDDLVAALSKKPVGQKTANEILDAGKVATRDPDPVDQLEALFTKKQSDFNLAPERGPLRASFPEDMVKSGVGDYSTMGKVLSDPSKYGPADIAEVASGLNKVDPTAFPSLVKQKFAKANEAARAPVAGRASVTAPGDFATDIAGGVGSDTRKNFKETMRQVANSHGLDAEAAASGAERFVDALQTISRDQGGAGLSGMPKQAAVNLPSKALRVFGFMPMQSAASSIEQAVYRNTYRKLAEAMTSEDGVKKLIAIAKWSHPEQAALTAARGIISTSADVQAQQTPVVQP